MKRLASSILLCFFTLLSSRAATVLDKDASPPRLIDEGRGYIVLGGEFGNSSATSPEDIRSNMEKVAAMGLNTVLVPAYWDLTEPREGDFDFALTDCVIDNARQNGLGVVFLWFGAWKNSMSCYAPGWVKRDAERFPRARTRSGKPLEIVTPYSEELLKADKKAFIEWLKHLETYDSAGTVKMVQIENEIGMLEDARDYSGLAQKAYGEGVPPELTDYLAANFTDLHPDLRERWEANGRKMKGSWREVFGDDIYADEYFMAWSFARYVERLARAGRDITSRPFYLNAALNSRGRLPGEYPSAGPLAHLKDIWHAGAPTIDFLSPDIYDTGFEQWTAQYALPDNALFIPEVRRDDANPAQAYYVIGHHKALGISPFSIENGDDEYASLLAPAYETIGRLVPLITSGNAYEFYDGVLLSREQPQSVLVDGDTRIRLAHFFTLPWDSRATDGHPWRESGAIIIKLAPDEYLLAGTGVVATFEDLSETTDEVERGEDGFAQTGGENRRVSPHGNTSRVGLATVEEVTITPEGDLKRIRTLNGDETHQGRHARISVDDNKILHITTYRYK